MTNKKVFCLIIFSVLHANQTQLHADSFENDELGANNVRYTRSAILPSTDAFEKKVFGPKQTPGDRILETDDEGIETDDESTKSSESLSSSSD